MHRLMTKHKTKHKTKQKPTHTHTQKKNSEKELSALEQKQQCTSFLKISYNNFQTQEAANIQNIHNSLCVQVRSYYFCT